jgi:hypothetical protein
LRYSSTPRKRRAQEGIPTALPDHRPVTEAILEGGYAWEEEVVGTLLAGKVHLAEADTGTTLRNRILSAADTRRLLTQLRPGEYVYQPTLVTSNAFYKAYKLDTAVVLMGDCRPDLIACFPGKSRLILRVIDVKASPGLKLSHRIQATLYTLILRHVLREWGVTDYVVEDQAGIWLAHAEAPEWFDTRAIRPPLEAFLEQELQPILERPPHEARWHLYFRCEWCPFFSHCRDEMQRGDSVSRMPYLSNHAKDFLSRLDPPVRTVADLEQMLADPGRTRALDDCASLQGRADRLRLQAKSLRTGKILLYGSSSLAMPKGEHVRLIITVQTEPVSGQIYAYGIYAQGLKDVLGDNPEPIIGVAERGDPATVAELERKLVRALHGLLLSVHEFNSRHDDWSAQKTLQTYTFDTYEWELLGGVLVRRLNDPVVAEQALQVFFHFQRPELLHAEEQPQDEVFFPAVVLVQVLRSLLALPAEVVYRFSDAVALLRPKTCGFEYQPDSYFTFELSNHMRSDAVFALWHQGQAEQTRRIAQEIRARLWATNGLVNGIRERLAADGRALFAWPPKFKLPVPFSHRNRLLSRLAFFTRYEMVLGYLALRKIRMAPLAERLWAADTLRLVYAGGDRFILDPMHQAIRLEEDALSQWLLTEDSDAGRNALLAYNDFLNRDRLWLPRNAALALARIVSVEGTVQCPNQAVRLELKISPATPPLKLGERYYLDRRFTDFNSEKVIAELEELDREDSPSFVRLTENPVQASVTPEVPRTVALHALGLAERHSMTRSQRRAFAGLLGRGVQLIWGPPGTGKTHFLALAILCLAESYRAAGLAFRALLTGFTHSAIDNCLRKVAELQKANRVVSGPFPVGKMKRTVLSDMDGVQVIDAQAGWAWSQLQPASLLGGTVWAIHKGYGPELADLVIIDEGSQLRVPESAIAARRVRPGGRLLIAGDDLQLPPIVQGTYPEQALGEPLLHRSMFECLRGQDRNQQFTAILLENWRMNRTLCRYPAEQIYMPEYQSATEQIASRRLPLAPEKGPDPLADSLLDPQYPLVIGILQGVRAAAENRVEAGLVARVARRLRERLLQASGDVYPDTAEGDGAFWKHGLFIVSPHHVQIQAIRRALFSDLQWRADPFVGTVDKMQGQECEAVAVSYGVSDAEYALGEREFIYSLNRLNVAITRAKTKTLVFLPRPLIEPPIQAYEDDRISAGVAFMQGLVQFAKHHGDERRFPLEEGAALLVYRVSG